MPSASDSAMAPRAIVERKHAAAFLGRRGCQRRGEQHQCEKCLVQDGSQHVGLFRAGDRCKRKIVQSKSVIIDLRQVDRARSVKMHRTAAGISSNPIPFESGLEWGMKRFHCCRRMMRADAGFHPDQARRYIGKAGRSLEISFITPRRLFQQYLPNAEHCEIRPSVIRGYPW